MPFNAPEKHRITVGPAASSKELNGNSGAFLVPPINHLSKLPLRVVASEERGWEVVSISLKSRAPTLQEVRTIKSMFWGPADTVLVFLWPDTTPQFADCVYLFRAIDGAERNVLPIDLARAHERAHLS